MRVILTGAKGILGSTFIERCDKDVIPISIRYKDKESYSKLKKEIKKADVLVHAGANLHPHSLEEAMRDNTYLIIDILNMVKKIANGFHVILISSMSVLGVDGKVKEINTMTDYTLSKYIMEEISKRYYSMNITIARFSTLFCWDPSKDGLSKMIYDAKKMGKIVAADCKRDFMPIQVGCVHLSNLCCNEKWYNETINIASGKALNMVSLGKYLAKKYNSALHKTVLPVYNNVCYKFSDMHELDDITFNIYDVIDMYYKTIG